MGIRQWAKRRKEEERGERWDGREKQLQVIIGWGRKGYRKVVDEQVRSKDTGHADDEGRGVFERVRWWCS